MANSVGLDQTAHIGAVCSGSTLFASILNSSVMLGNYLQQTTSADGIFRCIFLGALRVKVDVVFGKVNCVLVRSNETALVEQSAVNFVGSSRYATKQKDKDRHVRKPKQNLIEQPIIE